MALLFFDGMDLYQNSTDLRQRWDFVDTSGSAITISTSGGRTGLGAVNINQDDIGFYKIVDSVKTIIVGFSFKSSSFAATDNLLFVRSDVDAVVSCKLETNSSGNILLYRGNGTALLGTSTTTLNPDTWYFIELKWTTDPASGDGILRINETEEINFSGDTQESSETTVNTVFFTGPNTNHQFDDIYVCDDSGSDNNDFLGDVRVITMLPDRDTSSTDFTPSSGIDNYAMVNERFTDENTTYVESNIEGSRDLYGLEPITFKPALVFGTQTVMTVQKPNAGTRVARSILQSGITEVAGVDFTTHASYYKIYDIYEKNPSGDVAWTKNSINNVLIGHEIPIALLACGLSNPGFEDSLTDWSVRTTGIQNVVNEGGSVTAVSSIGAITSPNGGNLFVGVDHPSTTLGSFFEISAFTGHLINDIGLDESTIDSEDYDVFLEFYTASSVDLPGNVAPDSGGTTILIELYDEGLTPVGSGLFIFDDWLIEDFGTAGWNRRTFTSPLLATTRYVKIYYSIRAIDDTAIVTGGDDFCVTFPAACSGIINRGFETGDMTGWTGFSAVTSTANISGPNSGTYFASTSGIDSLEITTGIEIASLGISTADIDAGDVEFALSFYAASEGDITNPDVSVDLGTTSSASDTAVTFSDYTVDNFAGNGWQLQEFTGTVTASMRYFKITFLHDNGSNDFGIDDVCIRFYNTLNNP